VNCSVVRWRNVIELDWAVMDDTDLNVRSHNPHALRKGMLTKKRTVHVHRRFCTPLHHHSPANTSPSVVQVISKTCAVFLLGRVMTGLSSSYVFIPTSLYVAECAPGKLRGSFVGTVTQFDYQLGTCIAF
jgi:hypothetical protein